MLSWFGGVFSGLGRSSSSSVQQQVHSAATYSTRAALKGVSRCDYVPVLHNNCIVLPLFTPPPPPLQVCTAAVTSWIAHGIQVVVLPQHSRTVGHSLGVLTGALCGCSSTYGASPLNLALLAPTLKLSHLSICPLTLSLPQHRHTPPQQQHAHPPLLHSLYCC